MDVYITKLRKYLNEDEEIKIISLHNSGYRLMIKKKYLLFPSFNKSISIIYFTFAFIKIKSLFDKA